MRDHGFRLGYTWTKIRLQEAGLVKKASARGAHRKRRPRRALPGMLLFQDGSPHRWLVDLGRDLDLIATMDDATGEVVSAFLVEEEGTFSSFRGLRETIEKKGLFCAFYTDRGSHYFHSPKAGGKVDKGRLTQVGRALSSSSASSTSPPTRPRPGGASSGSSAPCKGASPRSCVWPASPAMDEANRYIAETFLLAFNDRFSVPAAGAGSAFLPYVGRALADILAIQDGRQVQNDNTVRYKGLVLQIPEQAHRRHFVKASVKVHEYPDASLAIFHGPRCLARYDQKGELLLEPNQQEVA